MKKFLILTFLIFGFAVSPVLSKELAGNVGISKEITSLKDKVFSNVVRSVDINNLPVIDPNFEENQNAIISEVRKIKDRNITVFSKGYYGVIFDNGSGYYCRNDGFITNYLYEDTGVYPKNLKIYDTKGILTQVSLLTSRESSYNYNAKGELVGFCQDNECFDKYGNTNCTRNSY
jgi:hypothetical protein